MLLFLPERRSSDYPWLILSLQLSCNDKRRNMHRKCTPKGFCLWIIWNVETLLQCICRILYSYGWLHWFRKIHCAWIFVQLSLENYVVTVNTVGLENTVGNNILFLSYFSRLEIHTYCMSCMGIEFPEGCSITNITEQEGRGERSGAYYRLYSPDS